jgi:hypothetical protein
MIDTQVPLFDLHLMLAVKGKDGSAALFTEIFDTQVRYSGASIGYQLGSVLGGAVAPLIAVRLLEIYKSAVPVAIYVALAAVLTIIGVLMAPEMRGRSLEEVDR